MIFALLITICKGGLWICIGVLIGNHLETILSLILRKPLPEGLITPDDIKKTKRVFKIIGLLIVLIGIGTMDELYYYFFEILFGFRIG
jgi:hypothetical protein